MSKYITKLPLEGRFKITFQYGANGREYGYDKHAGIDLISMVNDSRIYATGVGIVNYAGYDKYLGNYISINQEDGARHYYCHLSKINVKKGETVNNSTVIGIMGATGNVTGKHLHYEIRKFNSSGYTLINPADYMGIPNIIGEYDSINYRIYINNNEEFTVRVDKALAMVRKSPDSNSEVTGTGKLYRGNTFLAIDLVEGQSVYGNNKWYKSKKGNYVWSGGLSKI